jgi:hypothetical protein
MELAPHIRKLQTGLKVIGQFHAPATLSTSRIPYVKGCTNPKRQLARATKFCTVAPNICGYFQCETSFTSPFWGLEF